jgi:hypothetical protein
MGGIANIAPATQSSQTNSFSNILQNIVSGSVAVIQAVKQPTALYKPAIAGQPSGASQGAAQAQTSSAPDWSKYVIGIGVGLLGVAGVLAITKKRR